MKWDYIDRLAIIGLAAFLFGSSPAFAQISLGTAQNFGVLGGSTVTNTGATTVNGNVGVSPGSAVTGFGPGIVVGGSIHSNDAVAMQAQNDLTTAYNNIAATPCTVDLTGQNLGGLTLTPGVYCFSSSAQLTGALTLDALGNANALFLFKVGGTLTTASGSSVAIINNGGSSCNKVYWQVGSSANIGSGASFAGDILALTSITLANGANTNGRALARNGAVTLDTNNVNTCGVSVCPIITVNPATLPNGSVGTPYNQTASASGGTAPYTFSVSSGAQPTGLLLNSSTGALTGTPTTAGTFTFTITATDANGCSGSRQYSITIASPGCPAITLSPTTLPPGTAQLPYSQTITASGGTAPYTFAIAGGALPAGLSLNPATGLISVTPQQSGLFTFTIRATDAVGCQGSRAYTLAIHVAPPSIAKAFNPTSIPLNGTSSLTFTITNPAANTASLTGVGFTDTLPAGLTVANGSSSVCGGTLTTSGGNTISLSGATIAVNSNCAFPVTVTGAVAGIYTNTTGAVSSTNGGTGNTATANLTVVAIPDLTLTKSHSGLFSIGQIGATYTITVNNIGTGPTSAIVTVTDTLPTGLTATAMSGTGWSCTLGTLNCTRSDALAAGSSYPPITLTVNVAMSITPTVTNTATVAGGGEINTANDTASDITPIGGAVPALSPTMLLLLAALLGLIGTRFVRG